MELEQKIKDLHELSSLYDQVGEVTIYEQDYIDNIDKFVWNDNYDAVETLYDLESCETGIEMFEQLFGCKSSQLPQLADEFGFVVPTCLKIIKNKGV